MDLGEMNTADLGVSDTAPTEQTAPEPEDQDSPIDLDAPDDEAEQSDEEFGHEQPADPFAGYEEIDLDGKKYRVPADIKDGYLRNADYTQKTQAVAAMRRELEAKTADLELRSQASDEELQAHAVLMNLDSELANYHDVDWATYHNSDPLEAQQQYIRYQELEKHRQRVVGVQNELYHQRSQFNEQETASRLKATLDFAEKQIPGWSDELATKITDTAFREFGLTQEMLVSAYSPQIIKALYLAHVGLQTLNRQKSAKPATAHIQPTQTVSAKGAPAVTKDPENMSMSEYAAYRQRQMAKR